MNFGSFVGLCVLWAASGLTGNPVPKAPPQAVAQQAATQEPAGNSSEPSPRQDQTNPTQAKPDQPQTSPPGKNTEAATSASAVSKSNQKKPSPKKRHHPARKKSTAQTSTAPDAGPTKTVVRNGGTSETPVRLTPGSTDQAARQRDATEKVLASAQENLNKMADRDLSASQQEIIKQVRQFMGQARTAVAAGDFERGQNFARKALLLSQELVQP